MRHYLNNAYSTDLKDVLTIKYILVTVFCNGINNVDAVATPCVFWVTDKTFPLSPIDCKAVKMDSGEITISCMEGHDGGLPQVDFNLYIFLYIYTVLCKTMRQWC